MFLKGIISEDFINYKKPCMVLEFPSCTWKCDVDAKQSVCQNHQLAYTPAQNYDVQELVNFYLNNNITEAIVCAGLEPFDSFNELNDFIVTLRKYCDDDIVIFTGYNKDEIDSYINSIINYKNIIVKYGRYIPNREIRFDDVLQIYLASDNQYAEKIS